MMKNLHVFCVVVFTLTLHFSLNAQNEYVPLKIGTNYETRLIEELKTQYESDVKKIEGEFKKKKKEYFKLRFNTLVEKAESEDFISNMEFNQYFGGIFQKIIKANPILNKRDLRLLISKYSWPNAGSYGEGSIQLNLGLISRLENESQVAFVLCHELAHDCENHVNNAIDETCEKLYGKETQKKLKALARKKGEVFDEVMALVDELSFDMRRHSRRYEVEADSIALLFMANANYDTKESINVLKILDEIDKPKRPQIIDFKKYFDTPDFQIKDRWLVKDEGTGMIYSELSEEKKDSLKTHPDCKKRISIAEKFSHTATEDQSTNDFKKYIELADYEIIQGEYFSNNFGLALFHSFLLLDEKPDDAYLHLIVMRCLYELYEYQLSHELGKVLDIPDRRYDENYNHFLSFFHNLRIRDLSKLGYAYGLKNGKPFTQNDSFRAAHLIASAPSLPLSDWFKMKKEYYSDFPKGKYKNEIKEISDFLKNN